jgi:muramoyltetrapeptide carboxypeptidase
VSPSGPVPPERLDAGVAVLQSWGLRVRVMPNARSSHPVHAYLAGDDEARAADFTTAWADPDVRAILCVRGGYGAQRMADLVDWAALADAEPTVLVGYSDVTALHQAVATRLGVVSLHGPMTSTSDFLDSPVAQEHLRATLFEPDSVRVLSSPSAQPLVGGTAVGVTTGGCLSVLATSVATPSAHSTARGCLVLLEDCCEKAYRIDSYLTQLRRSGWFDGATGVALGSWADCEPAEPVVIDVLGHLGIPILGDLGFGHGHDPITVPLGALAELDADAGTLTLEKPALA